MHCPRCNKNNKKLLFLSVFNEQQICIFCKEEEEKHPLYTEALNSYITEELKGNFNFQGIGLPDDLMLL